ncbi:MAG: mandelate racemase/muconate lactonizing enzyme family protein [Proteobacteria bacterium]|nr:mandelate racemase/muconate lactonizing enzyme family protein [Pseudomonadota bacterium]
MSAAAAARRGARRGRAGPLRTRVRLLAARLHYEAGIRLFTALSGAVDSLVEHYLLFERSDGLAGLAEVRANISYLSGIPEGEVAGLIRRLVETMSWDGDPEALLEALPRLAERHPPVARAAVEGALVEALARSRGLSVAEVLGGEFRDSVPTNQCLFWSPDEVFDRLAARYLAEGFREIKVRVAIGAPEDDLARLSRLRARFGRGFELAIDANGAWQADQALRFLDRVAPLGIAYVEQPTPIGDWEAARRVGAVSPIPVMLDEGLKTGADIERLAGLGPPFLAHLKIVKLGGPLAVVAAAKRLAGAGVGVMLGQMNEGAVATALAVHCAMAIRPRHNELYGSYGLVDDPASGLAYGRGQARVARAPGLGVSFDPARADALWEVVI